jgi:hypothetical protein
MTSQSPHDTPHRRRQTIQSVPSGWEIRDEEDSRVVRRRVTDDWHRVERARLIFALETAGVEQGGEPDGSPRT